MQPQSKSNLLPLSLILFAGAIIVAVLVLVFSPMLWTDHLVTYATSHAVGSCSIQPTGSPGIFVAHCPLWAQP